VATVAGWAEDQIYASKAGTANNQNNSLPIHQDANDLTNGSTRYPP